MEGQVHSARTRAHNPARSTHDTPAGLLHPATAREDPQAAKLPAEQGARAESETALFLQATSMKGNAYSSVQELRLPDHQTSTRTAATSTVEIQPRTRAQAHTAHTMPRTALSVSCVSTDSIRSQGHVCKTGPHIDADECVSPRSALPSQEQGQGAQNLPAIGHQAANPMAAIAVRQYVEVVAEPKVQPRDKGYCPTLHLYNICIHSHMSQAYKDVHGDIEFMRVAVNPLQPNGEGPGEMLRRGDVVALFSPPSVETCITPWDPKDKAQGGYQACSATCFLFRDQRGTDYWWHLPGCICGRDGPEELKFCTRVLNGQVLVPKCPEGTVGLDGYSTPYSIVQHLPQVGNPSDLHGLTAYQMQVNHSNDSDRHKHNSRSAVTTDAAPASVTTITSPLLPQLPPSEQLNLVLVGYGESGKSSLMRRPIPHVGVKSTTPGGGPITCVRN